MLAKYRTVMMESVGLVDLIQFICHSDAGFVGANHVDGYDALFASVLVFFLSHVISSFSASLFLINLRCRSLVLFFFCFFLCFLVFDNAWC